MKKHLLSLLAVAAVSAGVAQAQDYCTYDGSLSRANADRMTTGLTVSCEAGTTEISLQSSATSPVYLDKTEYVIVVVPGETVTVTPSGVGDWMHNYLYCDWGNDGEFNVLLDNEAHTLAPGSDLVYYSLYGFAGSCQDNGKYVGGDKALYNMAGELVSEHLNDPYNSPVSFTVPADLAAGEYRVRYTVDWNSVDPCGHPELSGNTLSSNGGIIADFTIKVEEKAEERPEGMLKFSAVVDGDGNGTVKYREYGADFTVLESYAWVRSYTYYFLVEADEESEITKWSIYMPSQGVETEYPVSEDKKSGETTRPMPLSTDIEIHVTFSKTTSIDAVGVDTEAPAEYYNLQGVRVDSNSLVPGIYVRRSGDKAVKVLVK